MEISNRSLAMFLVVAIAISVFGTIISINKLNQVVQLKPTTGFASLNASATAQLTINTTASIRFYNNSVDFGSGSINITLVWCNLNTLGTKSNGCIGFNTVTQPFVLENDGSANVSVQLASNISAVSFLGGSNPQFQYNVTNNETGSCGVPAPAAFTDVNTTAPGTQICNVFTFIPTTNSINIGINVNMSYDAPAGAKSALLTATATAL